MNHVFHYIQRFLGKLSISLSIDKRILPVILLGFINFLNFSILIPVIPFLVKEYNINEVVYGVLLSLYPIAQILFVQFFAKLSDKFGRKPILFFTQLGTLISWVLFCIAYFVPNIPFLWVPLPIWIIGFSRIADGITGANMLVANAYIADITTKKDRVHTFAQIEAAVAIGSLVGPLAGSITVALPSSYLGTGLFAMIVSIIGLFAIQYFVVESIREKEHSVHINYFESLNFFNKIWKYRKNKNITNTYIYRFIFQFIFNAFVVVIFPFLISTYNIERSSYQMTLILILFGVTLVVNQLFLVPKTIALFGSTKIFFIGQLLMLGALISFSFSTNIAFLIAVFLLLMFGVSINLTLFKPFLTTNVKPNNLAEVIAIEEQIMTFTAAIAPIIATAVYIAMGSMTFFFFALLAMLGFALTYLINDEIYVHEGEDGGE